MTDASFCNENGSSRNKDSQGGAAIHENLWQGPHRTWNIFPNGGDRLDWISADTMLSDALTKSMKPDLLLSVLRSCVHQVDKNKERRAER